MNQSNRQGRLQRFSNLSRYLDAIQVAQGWQTVVSSRAVACNPPRSSP